MNLRQLFVAACYGAAVLTRGASFDLILRHGRVIDGTGNPAFHADVAIEDGRIAAVGRVEGKAPQEIDVRGLIVAPGFIDVHTHAEGIMELPRADNFVRMGITTLILGNCGDSELDLGAFFRRLEQTNISANVASLVGHNTVRRKVMGGSFDRPPSDAEMQRMREVITQAMRDGAIGFSTGLIYLPGTFAKTDELVELARTIAPFDGIYASHMRSEGREIYAALDEVFRVAREAGIRAEVSHLKLSGKAAWGQAEQVLAAIERARAEGLDITQDQYLYTAASTGLSQLIPDKWREGGRFREHLANPADKAQIIAEMKQRLKERGHDDYGYVVIADYEHDRTLNSLNVIEAAKRKRGGDSLDDQVELILDIQGHGGADGVFHGISEVDLRKFAQHPNTMFASDSNVRQFGSGVPHPRGYGNCARVLARYVRELKLLRLEDAIRRMTSLPADTFRLKNRGQVRESFAADLVIFDPSKVQDNATFAEPHQYATGFAWVLVNGVPVVHADTHAGARPGKVLRQGMAPAGPVQAGEKP